MPGYCLILEPTMLVARDLAATACENLGLKPLIAGTADDARALLAAPDLAGGIRLAFVNQPPGEFAASALRQALESQGVQIVLTGPHSRAADSAWPALVWPFATEHVLALMRRLGGGRCCKP